MPTPKPEIETLVELLCWRAQDQPDKIAYTFLVDGETNEQHLTYQELDHRAKMIAARLQQMGLAGTLALLLYPPGLEYITAFFGCLYAGTIAVPVYPPRRNRPDARLEAIARNSEAAVALTTTEILAHRKRILSASSGLQQLVWLNTDSKDCHLAAAWKKPKLTSKSLAFLQYTSGSVGSPKGVMVSHGNLWHNQAMIQASFSQDDQSVGVGWMPFYHDMGLIGNLLYSLYRGMPCVFMSPSAFIQQPIRWLQAISHYRGTVSGGPNFGYEQCIERITPDQLAELDLSCWDTAFNGAEPVRASTLACFAEKFGPCGFRYEAFHCCYGLAESTLFAAANAKLEPPDILTIRAEAPAAPPDRQAVVSARPPGEKTKLLVGCGRPWLDQKIVIAHPETKTTCGDDEEGEVWLSSPSVTHGYWNRPAETKETFQAYLKDTGEGPFLRTGDLGLLHQGQLYITGRLKDLIIIRGRNHYPQDIEQTVEQSHAALQSSGAGAFSLEVNGTEQLVVVQEIKRTYLRRLNEDQVLTNTVIQAIRWAVSKQHGVSIFSILLLKTMGLPKTSSGKVQRHACRAGYLNKSLDVVAVWQQADP